MGSGRIESTGVPVIHFGSPPPVRKKKKKGKKRDSVDTVRGDATDSAARDASIKHPEHYPAHPSGIEPIQIAKHESFGRGNIIKYVMRAPYKGAELSDLLKAQFYLEQEIERVQNAG